MMGLELRQREAGTFRLLRAFLARLVRFPSSLLARAADEVRRELLARLPRRTGRLAESLRVEERGDAVIVGLTASYARFLELGTRPHEIEARRARALAFERQGRLVFARRVLHPGIRPRFMAREAARALASSLPRLAREAWEHVAG